MITIDLDPKALGRVRFAFSPMWELASSLRLLLHDPGHRMHSPWRAWVMPRLEPGLLDLLRGLMPTPTVCPDFLTPTPGTRSRSFVTELSMIAATDADQARREIEFCWQQLPTGPVGAVLCDPGRGLARIVAALEQYWKQAIHPVWPHLRRVLNVELTYRADELAAGGLAPMLNRLHQNVSFDGNGLKIRSQHSIVRTAGTEGVVLVPSAFAWPDVRVVVCDPYPVTVCYATRGAGTLWRSHKDSNGHPVAKLIGNSRAAILALLDVPLSTTQIAHHTKLSLPAVSQHVAILREGGLVASRRSGRTLWNSRTELGTALLSSGDEGPPAVETSISIPEPPRRKHSRCHAV